ncbi:DUF4126 family protein [Terriglobus saanensis]|uniref:Putative transmembrane protein n=1 Tax=Terriglobus saanensis (strain ATCC BAA-1853 / DSM 23119 / SP1PR4) TaxID=401053 RepID=E8V7X1_TERSS|nr:DUF4126 family protein [Terriglobus saanensis]ADV82895.1 putative transmembrane protein [Terriglobus saanensis SP1PR4]
MSLIVLAFFIGVVAGLRALTPLAAVSWAARFGWLPLGGSWLAFMGYTWTPWVLSLLALGELFNDKLPKTPSRKVPAQFATRIVTGAVAGAAFGIATSSSIVGAIAGALGAVAGTLGGAEARSRLTNAIGGKDLPIALLEDFITVMSALLIVRQLA